MLTFYDLEMYIIGKEVVRMLDLNHNVEKSMALVWAKLTDYGAGELKILDTYLSRINARDPDSSRVTFTKKEYAELMGLDADIRTSQLRACTSKLLKNVVTIDFPDGSGYDQYPLFHKATTKLDKELGQVVIQIECHPDLKQAFFDLKENRYITYQLKNTIMLGSQYSMRLYSALMAKKYYGWKVGVDELRERLGATSPTYKEFKRFNNLVLKKAIAEINEVTNMHVEVEYIKKGRSIVMVHFKVEVEEPEKEKEDKPKFLPAAEPEEEQEVLWEVDNIPGINDDLGIVMSVLPIGFTREQAQVLRDLANDHVPYTVMSFEEKEMFISDYIQEKVLLMNADPTVKNHFAWLRSAIKNDYK